MDSETKQSVKNLMWDKKHENILIILQKCSYDLYKNYHKNYVKYKQRLEKYRIPIIIVSSISGFLSILNVGYVPAHTTKWISLIIGFFNLLITIISLIEHYKKIDDYMQNSLHSYHEFKKISDDISLILRKPPNERIDDGFYSIKKYYEMFQTAVSNSPVTEKLLPDLFSYNNILNDNFTNEMIEYSNSISPSPTKIKMPSLKHLSSNDIVLNMNSDDNSSDKSNKTVNVVPLDITNL